MKPVDFEDIYYRSYGFTTYNPVYSIFYDGKSEITAHSIPVYYYAKSIQFTVEYLNHMVPRNKLHRLTDCIYEKIEINGDTIEYHITEGNECDPTKVYLLYNCYHNRHIVLGHPLWKHKILPAYIDCEGNEYFWLPKLGGCTYNEALEYIKEISLMDMPTEKTYLREEWNCLIERPTKNSLNSIF